MKVLVLGASLNPRRYAYHAMNLLTEKGHEVIGIGRERGEVSGVEIRTDFTGVSDVHTVTLYINPSIQKQYLDKLIDLKPKRVIFNPGSENPDLIERLKAHQIAYTFSCTLVMLRTNGF